MDSSWENLTIQLGLKGLKGEILANKEHVKNKP